MRTVYSIAILFLFFAQTADCQTRDFNNTWLFGYSLFDTPKRIKEQINSDTNLIIIADKDIPRKSSLGDTLYLIYGRQLSPIVLNTFRLDSVLISLSGGRSWNNGFVKYEGKTKLLEAEYFSKEKNIIETLCKQILIDCKKGTKKSSRHKFKLATKGKETTIYEFEYADSVHGTCYIWIWVSLNYETLSYSLKIQETSSEN